MVADKWDARFLRLAEHIATWSKDPSTKCGAVIVDPAKRVVGTGYNGFARGVADDEVRYAIREKKYLYVVHAETNAILFSKCDLTGHTLYVWPFPCCARCAALVVQAGITRVVYPQGVKLKGLVERWKDDLAAAGVQFQEAGVSLEGVTL